MPHDPNESYFGDFTPIQSHKHELLKHYLGAWYPKIAATNRKALYLETHAGKGVHETGDVGSPMVALRTLLNHSRRQSIVDQCTFTLYLIEMNTDNVATLQAMLDAEPKDPKIRVEVKQGDFTVEFRNHLHRLSESGKDLVPTLVFMDPFGYGLPMDIVRTVLSYRSCEVLVNFMARSVAMAVRDKTKVQNLNLLYGSEAWQEALGIGDFHQQMDRLIDIYAKAAGAEWTTKLRLTGTTDYTLMHFTNHPEGRVEMKRSVWAITDRFGKGGTNQLLIKDRPDQATLIKVDPDTSPLKAAFRQRFAGQTFVHQDAVSWLVGEDYLDKHLHAVMQEGRKEGWLLTSHTKVFGPSMGVTPITITGKALL